MQGPCCGTLGVRLRWVAGCCCPGRPNAARPAVRLVGRLVYLPPMRFAPPPCSQHRPGMVPSSSPHRAVAPPSPPPSSPQTHPGGCVRPRNPSEELAVAQAATSWKQAMLAVYTCTDIITISSSAGILQLCRRAVCLVHKLAFATVQLCLQPADCRTMPATTPRHVTVWVTFGECVCVCGSCMCCRR